MEEFQRKLLSILEDISVSLERQSDFICSIYLTKDKKRIGTNDYAVYKNIETSNQLMKSLIVSVQKLTLSFEKRLTN